MKHAGMITTPVAPERVSEATRRQMVAQGNGGEDISRNSKCPCGSGKRFKRCCMVPLPRVMNKEAYKKGNVHPQHKGEAVPA